MDSVNTGPVSTNPKTWDLVTQIKGCGKLSYRERGGVWFAKIYLGISDDIYAYLRKPSYIHLRENGNHIAVFVCDKDHPGAIEIRKPSVSTCKSFHHVFLPKRLIGQMRTGRRMHHVYKRMIGFEPYVLVEDAFRA